MNEKDKALLDQFASSKESKQFVIAYGGDGTLLDVVAKNKTNKSIIPIRDYARCEKHKDLLEEVCTLKLAEGSSIRQGLKYTKHNFLNAYVNDEVFGKKAIAEIVVKASNPTEALRFSLVVNHKTYMEQCIADGFIFASAMGSHGYFKSVTRTIFLDSDSVGLGFIASTYGICNLVLRNTDKVKICFERDARAFMTFDKDVSEHDFPKGATIELEQSCDGAALFGYDVFCCPECRKLRNSTLVNDQWL